MENILPIRVFGCFWDSALSLNPVLDLVDNLLVNDCLKLPRKEELPRLRALKLCPIVRQEVIRAAATPDQS